MPTILDCRRPARPFEYILPNEEVTAKTPPNHHPRFGIALKERMDKLGIEGIVQYEGQPSGQRVTVADFLRKHLTGIRL